MYEITATENYDAWIDSLKDGTVRSRIALRLARLEMGNFGDHKALGDSLYELRFFFGSGFRIYYTLRGDTIVLLLTGGDKSTQKKDIKKARNLLDNLE